MGAMAQAINARERLIAGKAPPERQHWGFVANAMNSDPEGAAGEYPIELNGPF
jgi:hypothetical protein